MTHASMTLEECHPLISTPLWNSPHINEILRIRIASEHLPLTTRYILKRENSFSFCYTEATNHFHETKHFAA